jgi:hypothetical protein
MEGLQKIMKNCPDCQSLGCDLNPGLPKINQKCYMLEPDFQYLQLII